MDEKSNGEEIKTISLYDHTETLRDFLSQKYIKPNYDDETRALLTELIEMAIDVSAYNIKRNSEIQSKVLQFIKHQKGLELRRRQLFSNILRGAVYISGIIITVLTTVLLTIYLE